MFKLSRRANVLRVLGILAVVVITITTVLVLKKQNQDNIEVNAISSANDPVHIDTFPESDGYISYGDYSTPRLKIANGDDYNDIITEVAFCTLPSRSRIPVNGRVKTTRPSGVSENDFLKMKLMIFIFLRGYYDNISNPASVAAKTAGDMIFGIFSTNVSQMSLDLKRAYTHAIISFIYDESDARTYYTATDPTSDILAKLSRAKNQLEYLINENDNAVAAARNYKLFYVKGSESDNQQDVFWIESNPQYGKITVNKEDSATGETPQGSASFNGIKFTVFNASGFTIYNESTGNYYPNNEAITTKTLTGNNRTVTFDNLPAGPGIKYQVRETATNASYQINTEEIPPAELDEEGSNVNLLFKNDITKIDIEVNKYDSATHSSTPQGNASFEGVRFELYLAENQNPIRIGMMNIQPGNMITYKEISGSGNSVTFDNLPYAEYKIKEVIPGTGYEENDDTALVEPDDPIARFDNTPKYGKIVINKVDSSTNSCTGAFEGTTFKIINDSENAIRYIKNGTPINIPGKHEGQQTDREIDTLTLGAGQCKAEISGLPYGSYIIKETAASSGYNPNPEEMTVTIDDNTTKVENIPTATVTFPNDRTNINIIVHKRDDKIRTTCETQGGASFAGITFRLVTSDGQPVSGVADQTLGENQCEVTFNNLPLGNYKVIEVSAGAGGYTVASRPNNEQNVDPDNPEVTFYNSPVRGSVTIQKIDASTGTSIPSGNNTFNGTTFKITNRTGKAIWYGNNKIENNQTIVEGLTLNNNQSTIIVEGLPFGNYEVEETGANNGYQSPNGTKKQTVTISNAASPNVTVTFDNEPKLGKITIQKRDAITGTTPSGNNTFVGTTFKIYNNSTNAIMYDNQLRSPSLQTEFAYRTITTDNNASVEFANLPYGTYRIVETAVSAGYLLPDNGHNYIDITIPGNDGLDITKTFDNTPKTGSVTINKVDKETGTCATKRGYSFSGVEFEIINASNNPIEYGHKYVRQNERITTGTITGNNCSVVFNDLPYGNYIIKELKTSNNYVLDTETEYPVTIPNDNNVLNITTTVENQVIRGDLKILKKDADNKTTLSDVLFRVSALDENNQPIESHIVITDEHGIADTSVIPHSKNTNGYDELYEAFQPGDQPITYNKEYGTWFFREDDEGNYSSQIDDTLGALPYGKYLIEELECRSNLFCYIKENQSTIIDITNTDTVTIDWDNHCTVFSLKTTATDEKDGDKFVEINRKARIKDTIEYCVTPGLDFTIKGILMDKSTEQPLLVNGKPIEQVIHLNSETECGTTSMTFKFNAAMLAGKNVVVYESLYYGDELITNHEDITDEGQTVTIVSLYTYATNKETNEKVLAVDKDVEIKDTVKYCLKPGLQYTVKGVLMNKETKEPVLINGNPVEQTATFVPEKACGELDMYLALNTTGLGGGQFVIFESLYLGEKPLDEKTPIIEHKDFDNDAESVIVEPPVPNTGLFTRKSTESTTQNDSTIFIIGGFAIVIAIGGYGITRTFSRRNFFRK